MTGTTRLQTRSKIVSKIEGIVKRSNITRSSSDENAFQTAQISYMGQVADTEVIWPYGMYGNVPINSLCVTFSIGSQEEDRATFPSRSHKRIRKNLKPGEVGLGNFETKSEIFFDSDSNVIIIANNNLNITVKGNANITIDGDVIINATNATVNATKTTVTGNADINGKVNLGVAGVPIARIGDSVVGGVITTGSVNHTAS
jgi:phage gp45-like